MPKIITITAKTTGVYLPVEMHEGLKAVAKEDDRSVNYLINRAIEQFLASRSK